MHLLGWFDSNPLRRRATVVVTTLACLLLADCFIRGAKPTLSVYSSRPFHHKIGGVLRRPAPDIVLLGSSRAYFALVPEEFEKATGRSAFNLGVACSKIVEWQVMAEHLLPGLRPRLTVLGVNAGEFRSDAPPKYGARFLFNARDLVRYLRQDGWSTTVCGYYARQRLGPVWAGYDLRLELKMWTQERLAGVFPKYAQQAREMRRFLAEVCPFDGYEHPWLKGRSLHTVAQQAADDGATGEIAGFSPTSPAFAHLDDLLAWFKQQNLPVIVAYIPNCPRTEASWSGIEPRMMQTIAGLCAKHHVPFIPCPMNEIPRTDADYTDEFHVGLPLAHRLSRRIAEAAVALGAMPPAEQRLVRASSIEGRP